MKRGTKIGWLLIAVSIMLSVWVIISTSAEADTVVNGYTLSDDGKTLLAIPSDVKTIDVPDTVETIATGVFKNNTSITSVNIPDSVSDLGEGFKGCSALVSVTLGTRITSIPSSTFEGCTSLSIVNFPSTLASIEAEAFKNCYGLETITIPSSCSSVSQHAFDGCDNLIGFSLSGGSSTYSVSDNCLYTVDGKTLVCVPNGKTSITIPSSCVTIGEDAFTGCNRMASVTIPATVTTINEQSDWRPGQITGDFGSAAETYAFSKGITFIGTGNSGTTTPSYEITKGANQTYKKGSGATLSITGNGEFADFSGIQVDSANIDAANYSVAEGSTVVTLSNAYLESLNNGSHTFTIVWTDGTASTTFNVQAADGTSDDPSKPDKPGNSTGYTITSGAGGTWTKGSGGTYSITGSGPLSEFAGIKVDGTTVGASNYSATTSPTIITLSNAYLESLSVGTHSVTVVWTGGTATANFTVAAAGTTGSTGTTGKDSTGTTSKTTTTTTTKTSTGTGSSHTKDSTPKTADFSIDPRYFLALGVMLAGIAIVINGREKQINYVNKKRNE